MSLLSLKILLADFETMKTIQYMSDMYIHDICQDIREKYNYGEGGLDHGLLFKEQGVWLNPKKMLGHYDLKYADILEFRKKHRVLKVKTLDLSIKAILVDESQPVSILVDVVCQRIGLANADEYSFQRDLAEQPDKKKKKVESDAEGWLNPDKTFREQGMTEVDVVVLKKNVDRSDPVQLVLMYNQSHEMVLSGKHPCSLEEAAQFGGIQMQIEFGNHEPDKHKSHFIKLKNFVPPEYHKTKDLEKKIYAEHRKLQGTTDLNAKFRYIQLIRSMKTYGVSFFLVKEPASKTNKKPTSVLLGITKQSILRLDQNTKAMMTEWKLTQLRRWAATPKGFTLDFGDYAEKYYNVETMEGEQISRLIAGYIDIIIKRRNQLNMGADPVLEEHSVVEDYVQPGKANNVAIVNTNVTPRQAKHVNATSVNSLATSASPLAYSNAGGSSIPLGEIAVDLDLLENQNTTMQNIRNALGVMSTCARDLYTSTHLPPIANDPVARKWRQETAEISAEAVSSLIAVELAATSSLIMVCSSNMKEWDYNQVNESISTIISSISQITQSMRMLAGLTPSEEEASDLLGVGKALVDATCDLLAKLQPTTAGQFNIDTFFSASKAVGLASATVLGAIDRLDVTERNQEELLNAAKDVGDAVSRLIQLTNNASKQMHDQNGVKKLLEDAKISKDSSDIVLTNTYILASVISTPLCREHLIESAIMVRDAVSLISNHQMEGINKKLENDLQAAITATEECIAFLVEKARNVDNDIDYEIEAYYDQVMGAADDLVKWIAAPEQMITFAKELTVNSTRLVEILKTKAEIMDDGVELENLEEDAAAISDAIMKMVAAARTAATNPETIDNLYENVEVIKSLSCQACEPYVKSNVAQKLMQALKSTITCSNHVIGAARHAAGANTDQKSQLVLNRAGKNVTDRFPTMIELIRDTKELPKNFLTRHQLMEACEEFLVPIQALIGAGMSASSTTSENGSKTQLINAAQQLTEELIHLQRLCQMMGEIISSENIESIIEPVQAAQSEMLKISETNYPSNTIDMNDADSEFTSQANRIQNALKELALKSSSGSLKERQAAYVNVLKEYKKLNVSLGAICNISSHDDNSQALLQKAFALGNEIAKLIAASRVESNDMNDILNDVDMSISQLIISTPKAIELSQKELQRKKDIEDQKKAGFEKIEHLEMESQKKLEIEYQKIIDLKASQISLSFEQSGDNGNHQASLNDDTSGNALEDEAAALSDLIMKIVLASDSKLNPKQVNYTEKVLSFAKEMSIKSVKMAEELKSKSESTEEKFSLENDAAALSEAILRMVVSSKSNDMLISAPLKTLMINKHVKQASFLETPIMSPISAKNFNVEVINIGECKTALSEAIMKMVAAVKNPGAPNSSKNLSEPVDKPVIKAVDKKVIELPLSEVEETNPHAIAERELLVSANNLDLEAQKLSIFISMPASTLGDSNNDNILDGAKTIAGACSALVRAATHVQREIISKTPSENLNSGKAMYYSDGTWSDGLISASKLVVEATYDLCDAANQAAMNMAGIEFVVVTARNVSSATVKLLTASSVRANKTSLANQDLQAAGKAVIDAATRFVTRAENARRAEIEDSPVKNTSEAKAKAAEMDAQVNILRMEKELDTERHRLAGLRKAKYQSSTNVLLSSFDDRNTSSTNSKYQASNNSLLSSVDNLNSKEVFAASTTSANPSSSSTIAPPEKSWEPRAEYEIDASLLAFPSKSSPSSPSVKVLPKAEPKKGNRLIG